MDAAAAWLRIMHFGTNSCHRVGITNLEGFKMATYTHRPELSVGTEC